MIENTFKIALVDDSQDDLNLCIKLLNQYGEQNSITFDIQSFLTGDSFLMKYKGQYDFIILDINLNSSNGIDLARSIRSKDEEVLIMFATNLAKYATKGYEVDAIDFVLKPLNEASFFLKLERVMKRLNKRHQSFIILPNAGGFNKVNVDDINYIEVISHDIIFHLSNGEDLTLTGTLKKYEEELKKEWFIRCNSCYLVNAKKIKRIEKLDIYLVSGEIIAISHPKRKSFMDSFKKYVMEGGK